jgi:hypothetical protein
VKVIADGLGGYDVQVDNSPLRQGAWVLFRISRESAYGNYRPWMARAEEVRNDLDKLMENWGLGGKTDAEVKTELEATLKGDHVADRILAMRSVIESDSVLSITEQGLEKTKLITLLTIAKAAAVKPNNSQEYFTEVKKFEDSLINGAVPTSEVARTVANQEFNLLEKQAIDETEDPHLVRLSRLGGGEFAMSTSEGSGDTSLLTAEQREQKNQSVLRSILRSNANSVKEAVSWTEPELWKQLGETERARRAKQKK